MSSLYLGLVHYPVLNKHDETVLASVTNLDIHDLARSAATYGLKKYYIITPDRTQIDFVNKIIDFWRNGSGKSYNPDRSAALNIIQTQESIQNTINQITMQEAMRPIVISTTARLLENQISFAKVSDFLNENRPVLLLFGTGHGLTDNVHNEADCVLQPVTGFGDYNHLSVRSAVAIVLDRISSAVYKGRN